MNTPSYSNWILTNMIIRLEKRVIKLENKLRTYETYNMSSYNLHSVLCNCEECCIKRKIKYRNII